MAFRDVLLAALCLLDVASGAILALSFGFVVLPAAAGFLVGGIGSLVTGAITPISYQQENLTLTVRLSKDMRVRVSMIIVAAFLTGLLGVLGLPQWIVESVGRPIFLGMLAGVGLYLASVGWDLAEENRWIGWPCGVVALLLQWKTNDLVWAIAASVPLGIVIKQIMDRFFRKEIPEAEVAVPQYESFRQMVKAEFKLIQPMLSPEVILGALAISTLTLGGNIAYTAANWDIAERVGGLYNEVSIISGVADFVSSLFAGAPMEVIVSGTATAPNPVISGALLMFGAAILLLTGVMHKVARYVPIPAMGGYLLAIGAVLVSPFNFVEAFSTGNPVVVTMTVLITWKLNPFYGLVAGVLTKAAMGWLGVL